MATQKKSPELLLPQSEDIKTRLKQHLEKIEEEIKDYDAKHPAQHPERRASAMAQQIYEVRILKQLFASGGVSARDLSNEIILEREEKEEGRFHTAFVFAFGFTFNDAWRTISSLVAN